LGRTAHIVNYAIEPERKVSKTKERDPHSQNSETPLKKEKREGCTQSRKKGGVTGRRDSVINSEGLMSGEGMLSAPLKEVQWREGG